MFGAILVAGCVCSIVVACLGDTQELRSVVAAAGVVLIVSLFALGFLFRYGSGTVTILALTFLRVGLTMALASFVAWKFPSLRTLAFFLSVTVVYMAGLVVETWLVWKDQQRPEVRTSQG